MAYYAYPFHGKRVKCPVCKAVTQFPGRDPSNVSLNEELVVVASSGGKGMKSSKAKIDLSAFAILITFNLLTSRPIQKLLMRLSQD